MKYIKIFEKFTKDYMKKIDLKDFKKIKKGSKILYMGGQVEVIDNNGYVLKLKNKEGKILTVNKSQFDHGGQINSSYEDLTEINRSQVSGTKSGWMDSLEDRKYELKKDVKGATIGSFSNVTLPKGTIIYNLPGGVFADHFSLKNKYSSRSSQGPKYFDKPTFKGIMIRQMPAVLYAIEKNSKVLESVNEGTYNSKNHIGDTSDGQGSNAEIYKKGKGYYVVVSGEVDYDFTAKNDKELLQKLKDNEFDSTDILEASSTDGGDKSNGNAHHEDHTDNTVAQHWKDTYGEEFHSKYPAVAKIVKQRNIKDKRELKRIWDETYGENFEEQYPALYNKLD